MVLEDHLKWRSKLIPPLRRYMGNKIKFYSWSYKIAPELLWISILIDKVGYTEAVNLVSAFSVTASNVSKLNPKPVFATMNSFSNLSIEEKEKILREIDQGVLHSFNFHLGLISVIWPVNPLSFVGLNSAYTKDEVISYLSGIKELLDPNSRLSTLTAALFVYIGFAQDKVKFTERVYEKQATVFDDILDYPHTKESEDAGSFFRATAPMLVYGDKTPEEYLGWADPFWNALSEMGQCTGEYQDIPELPDVSEGYKGFLSAFIHFAHADFRVREQFLKLDVGRPHERQVILALLARQTTLAIEIVSNPGIWNPNTAPIILRVMADVHIAFVWILQDPTSRVPMYVEDGLGAVKLEIAHRKSEIQKMEEEKLQSHLDYIEFLEEWLESQQREFLVEVNLGSWSGKNTRKMAEDSSCIDFYNYVYQPFSSAVHSTWAHVGRFNVEYCQNPTHNHHFLPVIPAFRPDEHWCLMAGKYLAKSFNSFDEFLGKKDIPIDSYNVIFDAFTESDVG